MVGFAATYVDADTFTLVGDQTTEFSVNRRVKADCGVDGNKYGTIQSVSYSSPNTIINLFSTNDNLTSNLVLVWYGEQSSGDSGTVPIHNHNGNEGTGGLVESNAGYNYYYPDYNEADQGVVGYGVTINTFVDAIGSDSATIYLKHNSGSVITTYTLTTSETIPSNITLEIENGAILDGVGTFTINGPFKSVLSQVFGSGITITGLRLVYPEWWGADSTGVVENGVAFSAAIAALPTGGGRMVIGPGIWDLDTDPSNGITKTIYYDISPGTTFTGTASGTGVGSFNAMITNSDQTATGPYIKSYDGLTAGTGGAGAHNIEVIQQIGKDETIVGQFIGAETYSLEGGVGGVWGINIVAIAQATSSNNVIGIEIDLGRSTNSTSEVKGIQITGTGNIAVQTGLEINHLHGFEYGIILGDAKKGIVVTTSEDNPAVGINVVPKPSFEATSCGIMVGPYSFIQSGVALVLQQFVNDKDTIQIFRKTDSAPTGNAFRVVNAADDDTITSIDINGNITTDGYLSVVGSIFGANLKATGAATVTAGSLSLGAGVSTTVGAAGGADALPATPLGYLVAYIADETQVKIPYFVV